jgi:hypothetical protein
MVLHPRDEMLKGDKGGWARPHTANPWDDLFTLAREIEEAVAMGAPIDPKKARRLACRVLALDARVDPRPLRTAPLSTRH